LSHKGKAIWCLVLTAILWSLSGVLIKEVAWSPLAIAGARSFIAASFLLIYTRNFHFRFSFDEIAGALAYTCTVILFVSATKLTTAANAILLQYTAPIYVALFGAWSMLGGLIVLGAVMLRGIVSVRCRHQKRKLIFKY